MLIAWIVQVIVGVEMKQCTFKTTANKLGGQMSKMVLLRATTADHACMSPEALQRNTIHEKSKTVPTKLVVMKSHAGCM